MYSYAETPPPRNRRLARELYAAAGGSCFFTVRCSLDRKPFLDPRLASIAIDCLRGQQQKSGCCLQAFCVMPDHVHFLVAPVEDGRSTLTFTDRWKGWTSLELGRAGWQGKVWQPRNYDHLVRNDESLEEIARYIVGNPVRKGLCTSWEEYPWCGMVLGDEE